MGANGSKWEREGGHPAHHKVIHAPAEELDAPYPLLLTVLPRRIKEEMATCDQLQHVELDAGGF